MFNRRRKAIDAQLAYLKEPRPLPMGRKEFDEWADAIFHAAQIPGLTWESARFALSEMILHVKPTQSFECYGYFVHQLRKGAANQVAHVIFTEIKEAQRKRIIEEAKTKEVQPLVTNEPKVLENPDVQKTAH